jgi:hypothetical protein
MKNLSMFGILVFVLSTVACGGGGSSSPSGPSIPTVAGNYAGSGTLVYPELGESAVCTATTTITQAGSIVNLGNIRGGGPCSGGSGFPAGEVTIDTNGAIVGGTTGSYFDTDCGGTYSYTLSGSFSGRDLRLSVSAASQVCWNYNFTGTLTR